MKTCIQTLAILTTVLSLSKADGGDVMHFAFEITRHGARAPTNSTAYQVGPNQLTAEGMRQRCLLGHNNRKRYTEDYDLIDLEGDLNAQVHMESTIFNRTMQSGYSELLGMFPPMNSTKEALSADQVAALRADGRSAPPFGVRNTADIEAALGDLALPFGYNQIPIYNKNNQPLDDDLDMGGCTYVSEVDGYRFPANSTYEPEPRGYLTQGLYEPINQYWALNQTWEEFKNISFMDLYDYCDQV